MNIVRQKELLIAQHYINVLQTRADCNGEDLIAPDGQWDIMVYRLNGNVQVLLFDRPLLQPARVPVVEGQEQLIISFYAGSYMTGVTRSDTGVQFLPVHDNETFQLGDSIFTIPSFETVEDTILALIREGLLIQDKIVATSASKQKPGASTRTVQRQFRQVTGMTPHYYAQAGRARSAEALLRQGKSALEVAHTLGYTDQFHMTHSLKKFVGRTPRQIQQEKG